MVQPLDPGQLTGTVNWLEDEQRQSKGHLSKLQQQVDRLQSFLDDQAERQRNIDETLASLRSQIARLPMLEEHLKQTREQLGRLELLVTDLEKEQDKAKRTVEAELQNLRQALIELDQGIVELRSQIEGLVNKAQAVDEGEKRRVEKMAALEHSYQIVLKELEEIETRARLNAEHGKRNEEEIIRLQQETEALRAQDEVLASRQQVNAEIIKRVDEQMASVMAEEELRRNLAERVEVQKAELQRFASQLGSLEQLATHQVERLEEQTQQLRETVARNREAFDKMMTLRQEVWDTAQRVEERLAKLTQLQEKQHRRQILELEQQIKELRGYQTQQSEA